MTVTEDPGGLGDGGLGEAGTAARTAPGSPWLRPQSLLLTFCGGYLLDRGDAVFSGGLIDVLDRVGVKEHAARSTLARMTRRDLLTRHRHGKRVFYGLTEHAREVLRQGEERIWRQPAVNRDWDGRWTLLGFSLPERQRGDRHLLRSRLSWAGFGLLQNGLWLTPAAVDVDRLLEGLDVVDHVKAFRATMLAPTDVDQMIADAWDLDALAARYRAFLGRWDRPEPVPAARDDLARQLLLLTEWLMLVREDPRLPVEHLPADWPAVRAEHVTLRLRRVYEAPARRVAGEILEWAPRPEPAPRP
ncbi:PaaX family transcriptional regulator [Spirillospora sp. CA-255316]